MSAEDLVDAALAGLDQGEIVTINLARQGRVGWVRSRAPRNVHRLSSAVPARRYNIGNPQLTGT
jgi:hypothetical protein